MSRQKIHEAADRGDLKAIEQELKKGVDVNADGGDGWTPLHLATFSNQSDTMKFLIAKKADLNRQRTILGETPLMDAAAFSYEEAVKILLENKADTTIKDKDGQTALDWAKE